MYANNNNTDNDHISATNIILVYMRSLP